MKKVMFVASTGGHLEELMQLKNLFKKYDYHIITEKTKSTINLKKEYQDKINYLIYGSKDHFLVYPFKFIANLFIGLYYYLKVHPDVIISTGAHTGGIMCLIGKVFGSKIIFIETMANQEKKTLTGKVVYLFADLFIVQWKSMLKLYPKAIYRGWIF